jgi:hypothetical protein
MVPVRRVRAHAALFGALFGLCLMLTGVSAGLVSYLDTHARAVISASFEGAHGAARELQFDAPKSDDPAAQDAVARGIITRELTSAGGLPVTLRTTTSTGGEDWMWVLSPETASIHPDQLPALATIGGSIERALLADHRVAVQGVELSGGLAAHARALQLAIAPMNGVEPVPLLLIAAIGLVALAELGRLLVGVRAGETALLRSRGASAARIGATTAAEAATISLTGAVLGAVAAVGVLAATGSKPASPLPFGLATAGVVAAAVVLVAGTALLSARRTFRRGVADDTGRARRLAAPALLLLLTAATALSLWRYLQFGSPLAPTAAGAEVDPIAVLAPALCLAEIAVLGVVVFPFVAGAAERIALRGMGASGMLVWTQLARRLRLIASPMIVIALAGGGLVVAATYEPTWRVADVRTAQLHTGTDLAVTAEGPADTARIARVRGVDAASLARHSVATLDDESTVEVVAVPSSGFAATASDANGSVEPATLARDIRAMPTGIPVPDDATRLDLTVAWTINRPELTAQLVAADGSVAQASFTVVASSARAVATAPVPNVDDQTGEVLGYSPGPPAAAGTDHLTAPIPAHRGGWTLAALDAALEPTEVFFDNMRSTAAVSGVTVVTGSGSHSASVDGAWTAFAQNADVTSAGPLGYSALLASTLTVRLQPRHAAAIPIVLSRAFAQRLGARTGDALPLDIGIVPGPLGARVAAVVDEVPGSASSRAILLDLAAFQVATLRGGGTPATPSSAWVKAADAEGTAARIRAAIPGTTVTGPGLGVSVDALNAVPRALWIGMTGGVVLALLSLAAFAGEMVRLRASEVAVLRAVGMTPARQAGARRRELSIVVAAAGLIGMLGGGVTAVLVVPGLAHAAILDAFVGERPTLRLDGVALIVAIVAAAVVVAIVAVAYGAIVRRQAGTLTSLQVQR